MINEFFEAVFENWKYIAALIAVGLFYSKLRVKDSAQRKFDLVSEAYGILSEYHFEMQRWMQSEILAGQDPDADLKRKLLEHQRSENSVIYRSKVLLPVKTQERLEEVVYLCHKAFDEYHKGRQIADNKKQSPEWQIKGAEDSAHARHDSPTEINKKFKALKLDFNIILNGYLGTLYRYSFGRLTHRIWHFVLHFIIR